MRQLVIAALLAWPVSAQVAVDPSNTPEVKRLEPQAGDNIARCDVEPAKPALNFGLRLQAGYTLRVPLIQYSAAAHAWHVVMRITPQNAVASPTYLSDRFDIRANPHLELNAELTGRFLVGEGRYQVEFAVIDERGGVCRKEWTIAAAGERSIKIAMAPNRIADLSYSDPSGMAGGGGSTSRRLTVLMNVSAPDKPGMSTEDYRSALLSMLASLLEQLSGPPIRLVVFDFDQQKEILRNDGFTLRDMDKAAHAADDLEHWAVTVRDLQNQPGQWGLMANLIHNEASAAEHSDIVILLGSKIGSPGLDVPRSLQADKLAGQRLVYLQYSPGPDAKFSRSGGGGNGSAGKGARGLGSPAVQNAAAPVQPQGEPPDAIEMVVARLKGKTVAVRTPLDFAKAIEALKR